MNIAMNRTYFSWTVPSDCHECLIRLELGIHCDIIVLFCCKHVEGATYEFVPGTLFWNTTAQGCENILAFQCLPGTCPIPQEATSGPRSPSLQLCLGRGSGLASWGRGQFGAGWMEARGGLSSPPCLQYRVRSSHFPRLPCLYVSWFSCLRPSLFYYFIWLIIVLRKFFVLA